MDEWLRPRFAAPELAGPATGPGSGAPSAGHERLMGKRLLAVFCSVMSCVVPMMRTTAPSPSSSTRPWDRTQRTGPEVTTRWSISKPLRPFMTSIRRARKPGRSSGWIGARSSSSPEIGPEARP